MHDNHAVYLFDGGDQNRKPMSAITLRGICAASIVYGILLILLPEGKERSIASLCATASLVTMFLSLVMTTNWEGYSLTLAETRDAAAVIESNAEESRNRLSRLVIEQECEEYIMDKAANLGLKLDLVEISCSWDREGVWVPDSVSIMAEEDANAAEKLSSWIEAELGIEASRQEWRNETDP